MGTVVKSRIIKIGNSQEVRIPRPVSEQVGLPIGLLLLAALWCGTPASGQVLNPDNGHVYEFFPASDGPWTWNDADAKARSLRFQNMPGHLATVTTERENDFLIANFPQGDGWLGGVQEPGSPPASGWRWTTGEDWRYTHWIDGEPNDDSGNTEEDRLQWYPAGWNDNSGWRTMGFFVEFESYQLPDAARALRIAAGLETATPDDFLRLSADTAAPDQTINLPDAVRIARLAGA